MAILKVARLGHPVLRQKARAGAPLARSGRPASSGSSTTWSRRCASTTAPGWRANQVHTLLQIAVIEVEGNPRYPGGAGIPLTVLINPVVTPLGEEMEDGLGGVSLGPRHAGGGAALHGGAPAVLRPRGPDPVDLVAKDFFARVIQHETDHLNGIVYVDRMRDLRPSAYIAEWNKHWLGHP